MRTFKKILLITLMISSTFLMVMCKSENKDIPKKKIIPIKVIEIVKSKNPLPIHTSGKVSSEEEIKLSFKIGGIIKSIYVREGDFVNKGTLLAELDLSEIKAQVEQAKVGYDKALRDYNRVKNLYKDSVVTLETVQNAESGLNVAKSNLEIADFNLKHSQITAPGDGRILSQLAEENELIAGGQPVFFFGSSGKNWIIKAGVTDRDIIEVSISDSAKISVDAFPGIIFKGVVAEIGQAANPYNGTYEVEINVSNNKGKLKSGFIADVKIFPSINFEHFMIPVESLIEPAGNRGYVFIYNKASNSITKRSVNINTVTDNMVSILDGINEGEYVVAEGADYLSPESEVKIYE